MVIINAVCNLVAVMISMATSDRFGRRPLLLVGSFLQFAGMYTMASLGTPSDVTNAMKTGIIACLTITSFGFSLGWAPVCHIVTAELPSSRLRDVTYRYASAVSVITQ